jgi:mannose/fructose/N-acetylgalactosamine-specific phosphotransferase system component IIB
MSWLTQRVDDRLIHGQVVIAWGHRLHPQRIWVADDLAAANPWEKDLLATAAPGIEVRVVSVAEMAAAWAGENTAPGGAFLLVRDLATALALVEAGAAVTTFTLGGLHYAPGKAKVNEYIYLDQADRVRARALLTRGVALEVQDVPAARPQSLVVLDPESAPA